VRSFKDNLRPVFLRGAKVLGEPLRKAQEPQKPTIFAFFTFNRKLTGRFQGALGKAHETDKDFCVL
jgi:hypothetical protein